MDRLISEKQVLDAICHDKCGLSPNRCMSGITGECVQIKPIKAIPSAYKGMTNGEVIKAMFGDDKVSEFMGYARIMARVGNWFNEGVVAEFDRDWWNAPYQKGGKKRDYEAEFRNHSEMILNAQKVRVKE